MYRRAENVQIMDVDIVDAARALLALSRAEGAAAPASDVEPMRVRARRVIQHLPPPPGGYLPPAVEGSWDQEPPYHVAVALRDWHSARAARAAGTNPVRVHGVWPHLQAQARDMRSYVPAMH